MAKFCTKCGKPLVDGKTCSCSIKEKEEEKEKKIEEKEEEEVEVEEASSNELINSIVDIFKNIWKKPYKTMMQYKEKNVKLGLCLILINIVIFGVLIYFLINNTYNGIMTDMSNKLQGLAAISGEDFEVFQKVSLPFSSLFISGVINLAIGYLILITMSRLFVGKVFKAKGTFGDYLTMAGIASPLSGIIMVIAILVGFISYKLALIVAIAAAVTFLVSLTQAYVDILEAKEDRLAYSQTITLVSTYIITIIISVIIVSFTIYQQAANNSNTITNNTNNIFGTSAYIIK